MKQQWTSRGWAAACLLTAAAAACGDTGTTNGAVTSGAGTGAPAAGAAGGAPVVATGPFACPPASTKAPAELYAAAQGAFIEKMAGGNLPCAFGSCHNASKKVAGLNLAFGTTLAELVGKQSCEAGNLKLIEPGGGNTALAKSWFYQKLAAPVDGSAVLINDPAWGATASCGQMQGDYGMRMPISSGADGVGEEKLAIMREWICAGAPTM